MMRKSLLLTCLMAFFLSACGNRYKFDLDSPKELKLDNKLTVTLSEKNGLPIDSIRYYLDGKRLNANENFDLSNLKLGKHAVSATVFFEGKQKQLTNTLTLFADKAPDLYTYEVVNEYPHDGKAFTQGLEYHDGFLYETTGQFGESSLRKVNLTTGEVVKKKDLDKKYFGEGMTIFNNKIYVLTWQSRKGFVYDLNTFELEKEFYYGASQEGWGLTHDSNWLLKSDGSEKVWYLDADTLKEEKYIEAYMHDRKLEKLNELEFINGKIYANSWQNDLIAMINPENGLVEGIANLKGLQERAGQKGDDNVLNGIAYDAENDRLFVTGKRWNKLFEIKLKKK